MTEPQAVLHLGLVARRRRGGGAAAGGQADLEAWESQRPSPLGVLQGGGDLKEGQSVDSLTAYLKKITAVSKPGDVFIQKKQKNKRKGEQWNLVVQVRGCYSRFTNHMVKVH